MRLSQSKVQNRSTSSSQYFKKRFVQSQLQPSYLSSKNTNSYTPSSITSEGSKVVSQYEMFKPSQSINQPSPSLSQPSQSINHPSQSINHPRNCLQVNINQPSSYQKRNPFSNTNYSSIFNSQQDNKYENKLSKNTFAPKSNLHNNQYTHTQRYQQSKYHRQFQQAKQVKSPRTSKKFNSSHKQNLKSFNKVPCLLNKKTSTNTQLIQPITLIKNSSSEKNLFAPKINNYSTHDISTQQQPHRILQHIYFTISHESDFTQVFKSFASQQKQKINLKFKHMLMEIQNTLNEIKIVFEKTVDQTYQNLLSQIKTLKQLAQIMWKNKTTKTLPNYKNQLPINLSRCQGIDQKQNYRPRSNSKYSFKKFSQSQVRSPQSNNYLLTQLCQEDQKLREYKKTRNFYFNESDQDRNQLDRDKLLKDMHKVSLSVAKVMKQCEDMFFDEVCLDNRQKHKGFVWFNQFSSINQYKEQSYNSNTQNPFENINSCINDQLSQFYNYVTAFRSNLKHKYVPSAK